MPDIAGGQERIITPSSHTPDERGDINYFKLVEPVEWAGIVPARRGDVRGNHWHPDQTQQLLIVTGLCLELTRPLDDPEAPITENLRRPNELIVTPPRIVHAFIYLEDTLSINLSKDGRELEDYDRHTKRLTLVQEEEIGSYALRYGVKL